MHFTPLYLYDVIDMKIICDLHPVVDMWIHTSSELCQSGCTNLHSAISLGLC